ncbi:MAG: hypothetical protein HYX63_18585 [Gammaproteobacteria bacterium]|nr:hypothetical protein [Gammaproteobacteria bacterium]
MLKTPQYWLLLLLALAAFILAFVNIGLVNSNQALSGSVANRQQYLQQSVQLQQVYQPMINSLASLAAKNNDSQIHDLLASQGINYTVNPAPATPATPAKN